MKCQMVFEPMPAYSYSSGFPQASYGHGVVGAVRCITHNMPMHSASNGETQCPLGKIDDRLERIEGLLAQLIPDKSDDI